MTHGRRLSLLSVPGIAIAMVAAQSPDTPGWQAAAGGKMSFDVASIKLGTRPRLPDFPLDSGNAKIQGGRFSFSVPLGIYISFAYKLAPNEEQTRAMLAHLPKWSGGLFEIEARAKGNPTKDQMRLMMQSLLADRLKLAVHFETREEPVYALTLVKPGKTGPKLRPHSEGPPCPDSFLPPGAPPSAGDVFPPNCETQQSMREKSGELLVGSRNTTMPLLAQAIYGFGTMAGEVDKPVIDQTGLNGRFDFTIEYSRGENALVARSAPPDGDAPPQNPNPQGAPFLSALREQLGLKLVSSEGPNRMLVIDHIEALSEN